METPMTFDSVETGAFRIAGKVTAPELYVEGWSQLLLGIPTSKILLHSVIEPKTEEANELRKVVATLTINTVTLLQLAQTILAAAKEREVQVLGGGDEYARQLRAALAQQGPVTMPPGAEFTPMP